MKATKITVKDTNDLLLDALYNATPDGWLLAKDSIKSNKVLKSVQTSVEYGHARTIVTLELLFDLKMYDK